MGLECSKVLVMPSVCVFVCTPSHPPPDIHMFFFFCEGSLCMHMCVGMCMWKSEDNLMFISSSTVHLFYEIGVHHWHGNHHVAIVPSESQGHACLLLLTSGTTSMQPYLFVSACLMLLCFHMSYRA